MFVDARPDTKPSKYSASMSSCVSNKAILGVVYTSLLLDNMLLTAVVPIIPDYLYELEHNASGLPEDIINENARVGVLFSSKAVVQLIANPFVGILTNRIGFTLPMILGCINLIVSSLVFALCHSYELLFFARSLQGIGSACFAVSGMALLAVTYPDDQERSRMMGVALGGIAMGVLVGYPFGGILYDFVGKETPFLIIAFLVFLNGILQIVILRPMAKPEKILIGTPIHILLKDPYILIVSGAVCVSTTAMAILEPCLPIWLMDTIHPAKWQLGTVFVPDSVGYLIGTNLGHVAYRLGRWLTAFCSLVLVGTCSILVPLSSAMSHLILPHFGIGLGIGLTDAALMPLLAHLVDTRHIAVYGRVYAIAQVAVSLAYCLGPLVGGEAVKSVGFPWLLRTVGILNLLYSPLCFILRNPPSLEETQAIIMASSPIDTYSATQRPKKECPLQYRRFSCSETSSD